jgi:hypothetical protein
MLLAYAWWRGTGLWRLGPHCGRIKQAGLGRNKLNSLRSQP